MGVGKKIFISITTIVCMVCLSLVGWYAWILFKAPTKIASDTYIIGNQTINKLDAVTGETTEDSRPFFEVNVFNNAFELKINELFDETETNFFTHGLQYISDGKLNFTELYRDIFNNLNISNLEYMSDIGTTTTEDYLLDKAWFEPSEIKRVTYKNSIYKAIGFVNTEIYEYASGADTKFVNTQEKINEETLFKLQIGDQIYGMQLKYDDIDISSKKAIAEIEEYLGTEGSGLLSKTHYYNKTYIYRAFDIHYLAELIYNSVSNVAAGTSEDIVLRFGDYFNYFTYDGSAYTQKVSAEIRDKLITQINSNYVIRVNKYDFNLDSSEKSLFNNYKGAENIKEEDIVNEILDYNLSKQIKNVTINDFDFIETDNSGAYILRLSEDFKSKIEKDKSLILLNIDLDLTDYGIELVGIEKSSLSDFKIYKATYKVNGVESEVQYV